MKTPKEIEQLAEQWFEVENTERWGGEVLGYIEGYSQCQEDMTDKKYTEEDIINIVNKSRQTGLTAEYLIIQLNKQD